MTGLLFCSGLVFIQRNVYTSVVGRDRYTSFETISGITKVHTLEMER